MSINLFVSSVSYWLKFSFKYSIGCSEGGNCQGPAFTLVCGWTPHLMLHEYLIVDDCVYVLAFMPFRECICVT